MHSILYSPDSEDLPDELNELAIEESSDCGLVRERSITGGCRATTFKPEKLVIIL